MSHMNKNKRPKLFAPLVTLAAANKFGYEVTSSIRLGVI